MKEIKNLKEFVKKISEMPVEKIDLPNFYIPNWPEDLGQIIIKTSAKRYIYVVYDSKVENLLVPKKTLFRKKLQVKIEKNGVINFKKKFNDYEDFGSDFSNLSKRVSTLLLFEQFKNEIFDKVYELVKEKLGKHNKIAEQVKEAFAPFIPGMVADNLEEN